MRASSTTPALVRCSLPVSRAPGVSLALVLALVGACNKEEESNLAKLAEEQSEVTPEVTPSANDGAQDPKTEGGQPAPKAASPMPVDANGQAVPALSGAAELVSAGAADRRISLRLALTDGAHYRVTTLGMLTLPLIEKPTGFIRDEDIELGACDGEGEGRSCRLTHHYRNYEAEPPTGKGLEADEAMVAGLTTSHTIDSSGLRTSGTSVEGEAAPKVSAQLAQVHRLYCIRLPSEPVGVGATWRDVCQMRQGGSLVTRELTWRLAKVEDSDEGTRAELEYAGRVRRTNPKGELISGEIKGMLYFWADAGEPHMMRERLVFVLDASKGLSTGTDFKVQFAKLGDDGEELIRTDGEPFEQPLHVLNDLRQVPPGATRDGELPSERR